jgi:hypothetical protein
MEWDVVGHFGGETSSKTTDLLMDVSEEGAMGSPPPLFSDCVREHTIEIECHGSSSSQRVTAYIFAGVANLGVVKSNGLCSLFDGGVDGCCCDLLWGAAFLAEVSGDGGGIGASIGHDVMDSSG